MIQRLGLQLQTILMLWFHTIVSGRFRELPKPLRFSFFIVLGDDAFGVVVIISIYRHKSNRLMVVDGVTALITPCLVENFYENFGPYLGRQYSSVAWDLEDLYLLVVESWLPQEHGSYVLAHGSADLGMIADICSDATHFKWMSWVWSAHFVPILVQEMHICVFLFIDIVNGLCYSFH